MLFNLIGNAIKFTHSGQVTIDGGQSDDYWWIHVKHTGVDIAADKLERVFKAFEQVNAEAERKHAG